MRVLDSVVTKFRGCGACHEGTEYGIELMEDGSIRRWVEGCNGYAGENRYAKRGELVSREDAKRELEAAIPAVEQEIDCLREQIVEKEEKLQNVRDMMTSLTRLNVP